MFSFLPTYVMYMIRNGQFSYFFNSVQFCLSMSITAYRTKVHFYVHFRSVNISATRNDIAKKNSDLMSLHPRHNFRLFTSAFGRNLFFRNERVNKICDILCYQWNDSNQICKCKQQKYIHCPKSILLYWNFIDQLFKKFMCIPVIISNHNFIV